MRTLSHVRWHLLLALAGALLVEWLHWEFVAFLVAMILAERCALVLWRRSRAAQTSSLQSDRPVASRDHPTRQAQRRLSLALKRVLGVECPSCRGYGCETCAYTGLD